MTTLQTRSIPYPECDASKLSHFRFGAFQDGVMLTTDQGAWFWLEKEHFDHLLAGTLEEESAVFQELCEKGFIRSHTNLEELAQQVRRRKNFLGNGPVLHQILLQDAKGSLALDTAKAIIDHAMQSTSSHLQFECVQGREPLDEDLLDFLISYAEEKNRYEKKRLQWTLRTPLNTVSPSAIVLLVKNRCAIHTDLYAFDAIHEGMDSQDAYFAVVKSNIDKIQQEMVRQEVDGIEFFATMRVRKEHLLRVQECLQSIADCGIQTVYLEPSLQGQNAIQPIEFQSFYTEAVHFLLDSNVNLTEGHTVACAFAIVRPDPFEHPYYWSPGGVGLGIHGYDTTGRIYPSAQAAQYGEESLSVGVVGQIEFQDALVHPNVKVLTIASLLDCLPGFNGHWATPFLSVDPIACYVHTGDLFEHLPSSPRVKVAIHRVETIFALLRGEESRREALEAWIERQA